MLKQPQNHWSDYHNHQHRQFHEKTSSEINLGAKQKQGQKMVPPPQDVEGHHRHHQHDELLYDDDDEDSEDVVEDGVLPIELEALDLNKSNCSSRRSSLKDEDSLFPHKCMCKKKNKSKNSKTLEEILGIQPESGLFESEAVTRVYRAEIPPLPQPPILPPPSITSSPTGT
jgi:hypothetical protein